MLSSKFFSLFAFAAAAVAQGFPKGEFLISNVGSKMVLQVADESLSSGALIVMSNRQTDNDAQIWSYTEGQGYLTNKYSNLVIEVPRTEGKEDLYRTRLIQAEPKKEGNDDLVQLWDYDAPSQHIFTLADTSACIFGNSSSGYVRVDFCDNDTSVPEYQWHFIEVEATVATQL